MQLDSLEIAGFCHFNRPALLDLRDLPSGLVAITGPNGHGKTRLLDAGIGGLYGPGQVNKAFPSREGVLATYATSRDAYIETQWTVDTRMFRARVNVDGQSRATDAVLEELFAQGPPRDLSLVQHSMPLNDGKVTTFKEAVAKVFPSRRQVLASVYAAQGREGSFVTLDQRGRMELFYELLADLKAMEAMAATARRCVEAADRTRAALQAQAAGLRGLSTELKLAELRDSVDRLTRERESGLFLRVGHEADLARLRAARDGHLAEAKRHVAAEAEVRAAQAALGAVAQERARCEEALHGLEVRAGRDKLAAQDRHEARLARLRERRRQEDRQFSETMHDRQDRIENNRQLLAKADEIRRAASTKRALEAAIADYRRRLDEVGTAHQAESEALARANYALARMDQDAQNLALARSHVAAFEKAPFGEACAPCDFMVLARSAKDEIPRLEAALAAGQGTQAERDERQQKAAALQVAARELRAVMATAEENLATAAQAAKYEDQIAQAEQRIAGYENEIAQARQQVRDRLDAIDAELEESQRTLDAELSQVMADTLKEATAIGTRQQQADAAKAGADRALQAAQEAELRTRPAQQALDRTDAELAVAQEAHTRNETALARLQEQLVFAAKVLAEAEAAGARAADVERRQRTAEDELLAWTLLAKALGRDGLPKLEVDAAGPTVADLTNDLLAVGYGTRFTVDIVTQVDRADKKGLKEEFDVLVFDNEYGGERRSIADLSGGERVVVEEALRSAIALFHNARNPRPIRTMWRDETTGALDDANRPRYVQMLRRIQQLGGFKHVLFITHDTQVAAQADAWVHIRDGQPTVTLPPYSEA